MELQIQILQKVPFTTKLNLALASRKLRSLMVKEKFFTQFDFSKITWVEDDLLHLIHDICTSVREFKLVGDYLQLSFRQTFSDIITPFRFVTVISLQRCPSVLSLDFLSLALLTLRKLELNFVHMLPASEFLQYVPVVANQLMCLIMQNNPQLTKYDLVNIVKRFVKLECLDICDSDYITPGTADTISCYCYNLEKFYFTMDFQVCDTSAWIDLLAHELEHVEFTEKVNAQLQNYFELEHNMEEGWNYDEVWVL